MIQVNQKIALSKFIIEFLLEEGWQNPSYDDLLQKLGNLNFTEETLLQHSQFICDQVLFSIINVNMIFLAV